MHVSFMSLDSGDTAVEAPPHLHKITPMDNWLKKLGTSVTEA